MALLKTLVFSVLLTFNHGSLKAFGQESPAIDEASCVCGINREILERLESIVKATPASVCSTPLPPALPPLPDSSLVTGPPALEESQTVSPTGQNELITEQIEDGGANQKPLIAQLQELSQQVEAQAQHESHQEGGIGGSINAEVQHAGSNQNPGTLAVELKPPATQISGQSIGAGDVNNDNGGGDPRKEDFIAKLAAEIHRLEAQILSIIPQAAVSSLTSAQAGGSASGSIGLSALSSTNNRPGTVAQLLQQIGTSGAANGASGNGGAEGQQRPQVISAPAPTQPAAVGQQQQSNDILNDNRGESPSGAAASVGGGTSGTASVGGSGSGQFGFNGQLAISAGGGVGGGFLVGLPTPSEPEILVKPSQSEKVDAQVMENAVESTVPGVVSNIFSNIQTLAIQTEQNKQPPMSHDKPGQLTSIDGSSVSVQGESTAQITAEGERLFIMWIEHQLSNLHLTASMASYIRKSALNLFRRIVKQYVERIGKIGGSLEDNARKATQLALNNTQNLITFLLKNYLNISGGLMQIIGEQVSRIGKQLDSTGDTIAHMSLNPLTIVTKVMDSLPNPSDYSKYFREFSKQLLGSSDQQLSQNQAFTTSGMAVEPSISGENNLLTQPQGLISKTMGALSKTLSSWLG